MIPSFISVRSASSRLPGKCFLSFGDGNVLEYVIDRALFNDLEAIVCTTWDPDDDRIEEICDEKKVPCFRGEPINKLKRWDDCCNFFDIRPQVSNKSNVSCLLSWLLNGIVSLVCMNE